MFLETEQRRALSISIVYLEDANVKTTAAVVVCQQSQTLMYLSPSSVTDFAILPAQRPMTGNNFIVNTR